MPKSPFKLFHRKRKQPTKLYAQEALAELGINILTVDRLNTRLEEIEPHLKQFKNDKTPTIKKLEELEKLIELAIIPYSKGRDTPAFQRIIRAWSRIIAFYRHIYKYPDLREKYQHVLESILKQEIYNPFLIIYTLGFSEDDLYKNLVTVIQTTELPHVDVTEKEDALSQLLFGGKKNE